MIRHHTSRLTRLLFTALLVLCRMPLPATPETPVPAEMPRVHVRGTATLDTVPDSYFAPPFKGVTKVTFDSYYFDKVCLVRLRAANGAGTLVWIDREKGTCHYWTRGKVELFETWNEEAPGATVGLLSPYEYIETARRQVTGKHDNLTVTTTEGPGPDGSTVRVREAPVVGRARNYTAFSTREYGLSSGTITRAKEILESHELGADGKQLPDKPDFGQCVRVAVECDDYDAHWPQLPRRIMIERREKNPDQVWQRMVCVVDSIEPIDAAARPTTLVRELSAGLHEKFVSHASQGRLSAISSGGVTPLRVAVAVVLALGVLYAFRRAIARGRSDAE